MLQGEVAYYQSQLMMQKTGMQYSICFRGIRKIHSTTLHHFCTQLQAEEGVIRRLLCMHSADTYTSFSILFPAHCMKALSISIILLRDGDFHQMAASDANHP